MKRFPDGFMYAGGIAANQAEGAYNVDGKGLSTTDMRKLGGASIHDYDVNFKGFEEGCDYPYTRAVHFYERYEEYLDQMQELGLNAFRTSISWSRIFPNGDDLEPNEAGLQYYENLVDAIRSRGMEPLMTLTHFELPLALAQKYGGWGSRELINIYLRYCEVLFKRLKGKVKYWISFNEINNSVIFPFWILGIDTRKSENPKQDLYQAIHHVFVANALSVKLLHEIDPDAKLGDMTSVSTIYPNSCNPTEVFEAYRLRRLKYFFKDVPVLGYYPHQMKRYFKENNIEIKMEEGDLYILKKYTVDYVTCSYYQSAVYGIGEEIISDTGGFSSKIKNPYLERTPWGWQIDPTGLRFVLNELYEKYHLPILISENGIGMLEELDENNTVKDPYRKEYIRDHMKAVMEAIEDGVEIMGYTYWGPFDIISASTCEMKKRYGFVYVNYEDDGSGDGKLYKKESFDWFKRVIETQGESLFED